MDRIEGYIYIIYNVLDITYYVILFTYLNNRKQITSIDNIHSNINYNTISEL